MFFGINYTKIVVASEQAFIIYVGASTNPTNSKYSIRLLKPTVPEQKLCYLLKDIHICVDELIQEFF
jgi:hypothetical protein